MDNKTICRCTHALNIHAGMHDRCMMVYEIESSSDPRFSPGQYMVCDCTEFKMDNLKYLEEQSK